MSEEYMVGYAKPPKETQWQKGQSGNPKGRPRKKPIEVDQQYRLSRLEAEIHFLATALELYAFAYEADFPKSGYPHAMRREAKEARKRAGITEKEKPAADDDKIPF